MNKIDQFILLVQGAVTKVKRESENEFLKSKYADLESVLDMIQPFFKEHQVGVQQVPHFYADARGWVLLTTFEIEGEKKTWDFPLLGTDSKTPMQSLGSAITFARRYQYKGIFNIVDTDDDANAVTPAGAPSKAARKSDVEKMLRAFAALNVGKGDVEAILQCDSDQFTAQDMESLKSVYAQLKSGKKKLADFTKEDQSWQA